MAIISRYEHTKTKIARRRETTAICNAIMEFLTPLFEKYLCPIKESNAKITRDGKRMKRVSSPISEIEVKTEKMITKAIPIALIIDALFRLLGSNRG